MNKREKDFEKFAKDAGLTIINWSLTGKQGGRVGGKLRASNGAEKTFSISTGRDDRQGDLNIQQWMRRFARENPATAMSAAVREIAPRIEIDHPRVQPIAVPEPAKRPTLTAASVREALARAPAPAPTPAPAPIAPPEPVAAPVQQTLSLVPQQKTENMTNKNAANDRNVLTQDEVIDLNDWVRATDATLFSTVGEMAAAATKALGFEVKITNLAQPLRRNKITHFERKAHATTEGAYELSYATAAVVLGIAQSLGVKIASEHVAVFERHGLIDPAASLKAA